MYNLVQLTSQTYVRCNSCQYSGLYCYTPNDADNITCPLCANIESSEVNKYVFVNRENKEEFVSMHLCVNCKVMFTLGCVHCKKGCIDDIVNAHLVKMYKYMGDEYEGMPLFQNVQEFHNTIKGISIVKLFCPNKGKVCSGVNGGDVSDVSVTCNIENVDFSQYVLNKVL